MTTHSTHSIVDSDDGDHGDSKGRQRKPSRRRRKYTSHVQGRKMTWRNVKNLVEDPDEQNNPRLAALARAGVGWAAGMPFHIGGQIGIVVFMTRDNIDLKKLQERRTEEYLLAAADMIGSAWAIWYISDRRNIGN